MGAQIGLYYPFIHFRSDAWLKLAALYWDKIARIVPPGFVTKDSDTVQRLRGEIGLVEDVPPSQRVLEDVGSQFTDLIRMHGSALAEQYSPRLTNLPLAPIQAFQGSVDAFQGSVDVRSESKPRHSEQPIIGVDNSLVPGADPRLSYIFFEGKMSEGLLRALIDSDLGLPLKAWGLVGVHPRLALIYMNVLATRIASNLLHPLADDVFDHVAIGCSPEQIAEALLDEPWTSVSAPAVDPEQLTVEFAMVAIQSVVPRNLESIPVGKIIEVRKRHGAELASFQRATHDLISKLPELNAATDAASVRIYLGALYEKTLRVELEALQKSMNSLGIDTALSAFSVKVAVPSVLSSASAMVGLWAMHLNPVVVGTAAVALGLVPVVRRQRQEATRVRQASDAAYLLRLQREVGPSRLVDDVARHAVRLLPRAVRKQRT